MYDVVDLVIIKDALVAYSRDKEVKRTKRLVVHVNKLIEETETMIKTILGVNHANSNDFGHIKRCLRVNRTYLERADYPAWVCAAEAAKIEAAEAAEVNATEHNGYDK